MLVTNGAAGVVQKYAYDAYGNNYEGSFTGSNNIGYNGKRYDGGTGWYDYGFRDYDSRTGRFTTVDPIRDGMNWYAYCGGDPINCVDLWGLSQESDKGGFLSKVGNIFSNAVNNVVDVVKTGYEKVTYFPFEERDEKNIIYESYDEIKDSVENGGSWKILKPEMSIYHQNGVGSPELKFICDDGREAVYTKDFSEDGSYQLYLDPKYKGTYNYCNPGDTPTGVTDIKGIVNFVAKGAGHFFADMLPYYLTGCKNERNQ